MTGRPDFITSIEALRKKVAATKDKGSQQQSSGLEPVKDDSFLNEEKGKEDSNYVSDEFCRVGQIFGLKYVGFNHQILAPGQRSSLPHAESEEDEFVLVLQGNPQVWVNGFIYDLRPYDCVAFAAGTGIAHCFLNNTDDEVALLSIGDRKLVSNKIIYVLNQAKQDAVPQREQWSDAPKHSLGPHDAIPDLRRGEAAEVSVVTTHVQNLSLTQRRDESGSPEQEKKRPEFIRNLRENLRDDDWGVGSYPGHLELLLPSSPIGHILGLKSLGVHQEVVLPGSRTSYPHAHLLEDEIVFVISGSVYAWIDGQSFQLQAGDIAVFPAGDGLSHCVYLPKESSDIGEILVIGNSKEEEKVFYSTHPELNKRFVAKNYYWDFHPSALHKPLYEETAFEGFLEDVQFPLTMVARDKGEQGTVVLEQNEVVTVRHYKDENNTEDEGERLCAELQRTRAAASLTWAMVRLSKEKLSHLPADNFHKVEEVPVPMELLEEPQGEPSDGVDLKNGHAFLLKKPYKVTLLAFEAKEELTVTAMAGQSFWFCTKKNGETGWIPRLALSRTILKPLSTWAPEAWLQSRCGPANK